MRHAMKKGALTLAISLGLLTAGWASASVVALTLPGQAPLVLDSR